MTSDRRIRITEGRSRLDLTAMVLDRDAPENAAALWTLAGLNRCFMVMHGMWTGPEISAQIPANEIAGVIDIPALPAENVTSHPAAGDIAITTVKAGEWPALPDGFLDLGLFYAPGARLLLPHGWIEASICAKIWPASMPAFAQACGVIRQNGACTLHLSQIA